MKKILLAISILSSLTCLKLNAQEIKRAQNVFIELGGQGLIFTANYDSRFGNRRDGLGGRAGIGYFAVNGDKITTIPLSLNYLLGKGNKFFEIGLGATIATVNIQFGDDFLFEDGSSNGVLGTMSFAYRVQPIDSGFSFRAGITPIFNKDNFIPYFGGISLGYTF
ncbi:hypothetical protein [Pedobacter sp. JCM 36344]|uniref:hypothetical protein n=1 Tax=Pedobacter sp. JCM 36344 TaxID=3374280 RepID=UPI00397E7DF9